MVTSSRCIVFGRGVALAAFATAVIGVPIRAAIATLPKPQEPAAGRESSVAAPTAVTKGASHSKVDLYGDPLPSGATMRLGTIRHRQEAPIHRIKYSADGKFVVTDGDDRRMRLWDLSASSHIGARIHA